MLKADKPGVLAKVATVFGAHRSASSRCCRSSGAKVADLVFIMHPVKEKDFFTALDEIGNLDVVADVDLRIRVIDG